MKRALLIPVVLICVLFAAPAVPCSCLKHSAEQALESSAAAFDAEVVKVRQVRFESPDEDYEGYNPLGQIATLRVLKSLKGPHQEGELIEFRTVIECCVCGIRVSRGERWRVYAYGKPPYEMHNCSGSYRLDSRGRN